MSIHIEAMRKSKRSIRMHEEVEIAYDIVFVLNANSKGWILDKICRVVERYSDLNCYFLYSERNDRLTSPLPKARAYFFGHFSIAFWTMARQPKVFGGRIFTYFTHFDQNKGISRDELIAFINVCDHVIAMNSSHQRALISLGADPEKVTAVIGGADPEVFLPHTRGDGIVGFVGAYYARKQPEKMLTLIRLMPDVQFLLLAPGPNDVENQGMLWKNWVEFAALQALPNLQYVEAPYEDYPSYYAKMDVLLSLSSQEGGPIPVIEAMMSNIVPLATNTGFAEDVLIGELSENILNINASVEIIAGAVRRALADRKTDTRALAKHFTWQSVGEGILDIIRPTLAFDRQIPVLGERAELQFDPKSAGWPLLVKGWSLEDHKAQFRDSTASLIFRLERKLAGRFKLTAGLALPDHGSEQPWHVAASLNGKPVFSGDVGATERSLIEIWIELSEADAAGKIEIAFTVSHPEGGRLRETATLLDFHWANLDPKIPAFRYEYGSSGDRDYLGRHWYPSERAGSWSKGVEAGTVAVFVPPAESDHDISLEVIGRVIGTSVEGGGDLTAHIFAAGKEIRQPITLNSDDLTPIALSPIHIPAGSSGPIIIRFIRARSFRPAELTPGSGDSRDLGFYLRSITASPEEGS